MNENIKIIEQFCIENKLIYSINQGNLPNSCYIEIENEKSLSRITMWIAGDCDLEVLSAELQTLVFWKHLTLKDKLINTFEEFSEFMKILTH